MSINGFANTLDILESAVLAVNPQEGVVLLNQFDIANSELTPQQQAKVFFLYGQVYEKNRELNKSITSYDKGIALVKYLPISDILIDSHLERSFALYLKTNDPAVYCEDRKQALIYARQHNNSELLAKTLTQNAFCYNQPDNVYQGISLLDEAMLIINKSDNINTHRKAMIYNATGSLYRSVGLHQQGYVNFEKAYQTWQSVNDVEDMFNMQHNMLSEAIKLSDWDKADKSIEAQFALAAMVDETKDLLFFSHLNAGRISLFTHDYNQAIVHLESAVSLNSTTKEQYFISSNYLYLSLAYFKNGKLEQAANAARIFRLDNHFPANQKTMLLKADAIIALDDNKPTLAANLLFQVIDIERKNSQDIVENQVVSRSLDHNFKVAEFENELLANKLAINELNWSSIADKQRINELRMSLFFVTLIVLVCIVLFLFFSRKTLKRRAQTDYLTGLSNRGHTFQKGQKIIERCWKKQKPAAVIIFDIDNFKAINDRYGHHIGDLAIKAAAMRTKSWLKKHDLVGRIGGEEFLIILEDTTQEEGFSISDRLRNGIASQSFQFEDQSVDFTISLGVAVLKDDVTSLTTLVKQADDALYQAKFSGKNKVYLSAQCA
ncbi:GGDEF domain-containing protein [Shewanella olleyana]|uniref:tetratricopeptide repeat-containing diguanylate cyclase n=1 Tax=Shewanella olleyana TaxID=135626 RepID=UPI0020100EA3|nr:GGDEF domain-containing protein [Shewanella olleyana]MCL1067354.1 GGDEF domain-containing protein [Shewanella olleyana]